MVNALTSFQFRGRRLSQGPERAKSGYHGTSCRVWKTHSFTAACLDKRDEARLLYSRRQNIFTHFLNILFFLRQRASYVWSVGLASRFWFEIPFFFPFTYFCFYFCVNQISRYQRMRKKYDSSTPLCSDVRPDLDTELHSILRSCV